MSKDKKKCRTPGATYHTRVYPHVIGVEVDLGRMFEIDEKKAQAIEADLHDMVEAVLATHLFERPQTADELKAARRKLRDVLRERQLQGRGMTQKKTQLPPVSELLGAPGAQHTETVDDEAEALDDDANWEALFSFSFEPREEGKERYPRVPSTVAAGAAFSAAYRPPAPWEDEYDDYVERYGRPVKEA
jgi:hypothetical protein